MLVSNFDFSTERLFQRILAINIPVILAQCLTYPLLRIQSLTFTNKPVHNLSPFRQIEYYLRTMQAEEKFPRLMSGLRYSIDHSMTYTTIRFLTFEYLLSKMTEFTKTTLYGCVLASTAFSTIVSQPSFNYRLLVSEVPINKFRSEVIKNRLVKLDKIQILKAGLAQSLLLNCLIASGEIALFVAIKNSYQGFNTDIAEIIPAFFVNLTTSILGHPLHRHRVITAHNLFDPSNKILNKWTMEGVWTSVARRTTYSTLLFSLYAMFMHQRTKSALEFSQGPKRHNNQRVQTYREGKSREEGRDLEKRRFREDQQEKKQK